MVVDTGDSLLCVHDFVEQLIKAVGLAHVLLVLALALSKLVFQAIDPLSKVLMDGLLHVHQGHVFLEVELI